MFDMFLRACLVIGLLACTSVASATSLVRVAHLSPDAPGVDVWVNGDIVLTNVSFTETSAYLPLDPGSYQVQVTPTGATMPIVIDANLTLAANTAYTVAATGLLGQNDLQPVVLIDDRTVDAANAKVRFTHASPDAPAVDIAVVGGPAVFPNVSFRGSSAYETLAPGSYDLEVRLAGTMTTVLPLGIVDLAPGVNLDVFAIGLVGDMTLGAQIVSTAVAAPAEVRVAHLSPDAPNVDVYVDGGLVLEDVPYLAVSDYLVLPAGTYQVEVTPTGTPAVVVIDAMLTLDAGTAYTVAATGLIANVDLSPIVLIDDRDSSATETKVRFVHTSPDAPAVDVAVTNGPVLFGDYEFREASPYLPVAPGSYDLEVRLAGTPTVALPLPGVVLTEGTNITVFAVGTLSQNTLGALPTVDVNERFVRGDANRDGSINLFDALLTLRQLFVTPVPGLCADAADFSDDGHLTIADPAGLLAYLFAGGTAPMAPFPAEGTDVTADALNCR